MYVKDIMLQDLMLQNYEDPEVRFQMALCYLQGTGGAICNPEKGMYLMNSAADQGHYAAIRYLTEEVGPVDEDNLAQWCTWAERGDAEAMFCVGNYLHFNDVPGTEKDIWRYITGAAAQGYEAALMLLAESQDECDEDEKQENNLPSSDCKGRPMRGKVQHWRHIICDVNGTEDDIRKILVKHGFWDRCKARALYHEAQTLLRRDDSLSEKEEEKGLKLLEEAMDLGDYAAMQQYKKMRPISPKTINHWVYMAEIGDLEAVARSKAFFRTHDPILKMIDEETTIDDRPGETMQMITMKITGYDPVGLENADTRERMQQEHTGAIAEELAIEYAAGSKSERSLPKALCCLHLAKDAGMDVKRVRSKLQRIQDCWMEGPNSNFK